MPRKRPSDYRAKLDAKDKRKLTQKLERARLAKLRADIKLVKARRRALYEFALDNLSDEDKLLWYVGRKQELEAQKAEMQERDLGDDTVPPPL